MRNPLPDLIAGGQLPKVRRAIDQQPASAHPDAMRAIEEVLQRYEAQFTPSPIDSERWYSYIPLYLEPFFQGMIRARAILGPGEHRFLEIGSGVGTKLALAHALGWHPTGLEIHRPYVQASRQVFPHCKVVHRDGSNTTHFYQQADLVYTYRIAVSRSEQDAINHRIADSLRPGRLFFCASGTGPYPDWLEHVGGLLWAKPAD